MLFSFLTTVLDVMVVIYIVIYFFIITFTKNVYDFPMTLPVVYNYKIFYLNHFIEISEGKHQSFEWRDLKPYTDLQTDSSCSLQTSFT